MKKYSFLAALYIFVCAFAAFAEQPDWPTLNGNPIECNFGFKEVATPTITLDASETLVLSDYLPASCLGFELRAASGSFIIGHPDNVASGTDRVGRIVPQGGTYSWSGLAGSFNGVIICDSDNTVIKIDAAWGQYEE